MSRFPRFAPLSVLALAVLIWTAGCKPSQDQNVANQPSAQPGAQDASSDPANANLAPVSNAQNEPAQSAPAQSAPASYSAPQSAPPAPSDNGYDQGAGQGSSGPDDSSYYGEQPEEWASDPPPPLPQYDQPPSPGDDYLWTPGYWGYAQNGYYWIPGVWVQAPYQGALWTPGYWGWHHNRYAFYRGYWGPHIGYYGGINYGFGYVGIGYQGGYWNSGRFYYNRAVNNVNVNIVHNVYNRTVIVNNNVRVAYNGPGGVQVRPRPAELAAWREPHAPPMTTQLQNQHAASANRAQFAAVNHGRPADLVAARPLQADRDVHPVAPPPIRNQPMPQPMQQQRGSIQPRPNGIPAGPANQPRVNQQAVNQPVRPEARPNPTPQAPVRPETRPSPGPLEHPNQAARPEVRPNTAPPPHANPPARPAEKPTPSRPESAPRIAPHPQPQAGQERPAGRPAASAPKSEEKPRAEAPRQVAPERSEPKKAPEKPGQEKERPQ